MRVPLADVTYTANRDVSARSHRSDGPREVWRELVQKDRRWTLVPSSGEGPHGERLLIETYDVRQIGGAEVARLRWTLTVAGHSSPYQPHGPPSQVAVTAAGVYFLSATDDDDKVARALRRKPDFAEPPRVIRSEEHHDGKNLEIETAKEGTKTICAGYGPQKDAADCENVCFGEICATKGAGIVALKGTYSPGDDDFVLQREEGNSSTKSQAVPPSESSPRDGGARSQ